MRVRFAGLTIAILAASPWVAAGESRLALDPAASRVAFVLDATGHEVHGSFGVVSGEVRFDPASGRASGRIVVDATSGDTANRKRDKKMHKSVLLSERHPEIVFEPTSFRGRLESEATSRIDVSGTVRLVGSAHPVELPVDVTSEGDRLHVRLEMTVPYVEWGLKDPSFFVLRVGKTVAVSIDLAGRVEPSAVGP